MRIHPTDTVISVDTNDPLVLLNSYVTACNHSVDFRDERFLRAKYDPRETYKLDIHNRDLRKDAGAQFVVDPGVSGIVLRAFYPYIGETYAYSHRQRDNMTVDFKQFLQGQRISFSVTKEPQYDY